MKVYRNSDGYIVTYTPDDVEAFDPDDRNPVSGPGYVSPLLGVKGFFEFDSSGNLQSMDNHQPEGTALAEFAVHCRDFAEAEERRSNRTSTVQCQECGGDLSEEGVHDIGGEG